MKSMVNQVQPNSDPSLTRNLPPGDFAQKGCNMNSLVVHLTLIMVWTLRFLAKQHKISFQQIAKAFSNSVPLDKKLSLTQSEFGIAARYSNYHIFS